MASQPRAPAPGRGQRFAVSALQGGLAVVAVFFVVLVAYLPHADTQGMDREENPWVRLQTAYVDWFKGERDDYEYPVHVDEQVHWVVGSAIQREDTLRHTDPYTGASRSDAPLSLRGLVHETGFWMAFATFQEMSGIAWIDVVRFAPALFAGLTAWLVWAGLRPWAGAPIAAALVALVPTTPRFLGPGFFVPIGLGLAWVAAVLLLTRYATRDRATLALLLAVGVWSFFIHLIIGFTVLLVLILALPLYLQAERRNVMLLGAGLLLPLLWMYDAFAPDVETEATKFAFLPVDFTIFDQLGIPFLVMWGVGLALMAAFPPTGRARIPLVGAAMASLVIMGFFALNFSLAEQRYALYDRWHQPFALAASVPVAYAVVTVVRLLRSASHWAFERWKPGTLPTRTSLAWPGKTTGALLALGATLLILSPGLGFHLSEPYYQTMQDEDWAAFNAAASLGPEYEVFLAHPWKAPVFTAMTGKLPLTWLSPGYPPVNGGDYDAYVTGQFGSGVWLVNRDVSIVFGPPLPSDPAYEPFAGGVSVLESNYVRELQAIRAQS